LHVSDLARARDLSPPRELDAAKNVRIASAAAARTPSKNEPLVLLKRRVRSRAA
jgi:hypothetical protein